MKFEDKLKEYIEKQDLILRDKLDYNKSFISIEDVDEIDNLVSLYIMYKNNVLGKMEAVFKDKIDSMDTLLSKHEIFDLLEQLK
jgi:hypothetical protein